ASKQNLETVMRSTSRGLSSALRAARMQSVIVVAQAALSIILLVGCTLLLRTVVHLQTHPLGYQTADVTRVDIGLSPQRWPTLQAANARLEQVASAFERMPGVSAVTLGGLGAPGGGPPTDLVWIEGEPEPVTSTG